MTVLDGKPASKFRVYDSLVMCTIVLASCTFLLILISAIVVTYVGPCCCNKYCNVRISSFGFLISISASPALILRL
jgi:hypothetical protein